MKKFLVILFLNFGCLASMVAVDDFERNRLLIQIKSVGEPKIIGKYLVFTQKPQFRHAGIAFEFEDYKILHTFSRIPYDNERSTRGMLFYILQIPENLENVNYRLELDGLWTSDPENANSFFDYTVGFSISSVNVIKTQSEKTKILEDGYVQFYYNGKPNDNVRVAGSFNSWDPFMYEMQEVRPGEYFFTLPLPKGKWFYAFFIGSNQIHDKTNHNVVFGKDGKQASVIEVK